MSPEKPANPAGEQPQDAEQDVAQAGEAEQKKPAAKKAARKAPAAKAEPSGKAKAPRKAPAKKAAKAKEPEAEKKAPAKKAAKPKEAAAEKPAETEKTAPAPARRGKAAPRPARRRVVRARARYVRTSARKARMVCGHLRGKSVQEARAILAFTPREVARDWSKLLESAVANAESNHELLGDELIVREAYADEGPTIKRFRPRAMGRATPIRKRTSHLTITLTPAPENGSGRRKG
jgi:large subunit ribosomal protein L22